MNPCHDQPSRHAYAYVWTFLACIHICVDVSDVHMQPSLGDHGHVLFVTAVWYVQVPHQALLPVLHTLG